MKRPSEDRKIRMPGAMDRGPVQFDSRAAKRTGDVLTIATSEVVTAPPTTTIIGAIKIMTSYGFGRLPIADPGTRRLLGFVTGVDVVDFLGGGIRHNLLKKKYEDALKLMYEKNVGGLPVVDEENRIKALITEHDFAKLVAGVNTGIKVEEFMSPNVITANGQMSIEKTTRMMVQQGGFRKLPVVQDSILMGMVTASDIMRYLGSGEAFGKVVTGDIGEVMSQPIKILVRRDLVSTEKDADLGRAAETMMEKGVGALPVMENGSLVGIITKRDFIRAFAEEKRGIIT
jgi:CBS domain-containing protein